MAGCVESSPADLVSSPPRRTRPSSGVSDPYFLWCALRRSSSSRKNIASTLRRSSVTAASPLGRASLARALGRRTTRWALDRSASGQAASPSLAASGAQHLLCASPQRPFAPLPHPALLLRACRVRVASQRPLHIDHRPATSLRPLTLLLSPCLSDMDAKPAVIPSPEVSQIAVPLGMGARIIIASDGALLARAPGQAPPFPTLSTAHARSMRMGVDAGALSVRRSLHRRPLGCCEAQERCPQLPHGHDEHCELSIAKGGAEGAKQRSPRPTRAQPHAISAGAGAGHVA